MKDNLFRGTYEKRPVNVDLPFEGGDGKRLGGDLVGLGGTEEGGGDAEAGDEEEKGRANHLRLQDSWACIVARPLGKKRGKLTRSRAYLSILKLRRVL